LDSNAQRSTFILSGVEGLNVLFSAPQAAQFIAVLRVLVVQKQLMLNAKAAPYGDGLVFVSNYSGLGGQK